MGVVDAEAVSEADETKQEIDVSDTYKEETADPKAETGSMQPDPADIFKGKITMGGRPVENPESSSEDQSKEGRSGEDAMKDVERVRLRKMLSRPESMRMRTCLSVMGECL